MYGALPVRLGLVVLLCAVGCGGGKREEPRSAADPRSRIHGLGDEAEVETSSLEGGDALDLAKVERQIVYRATVELRVEDFSDVPDRVAQVVEKHAGFVKDSSVSGMSGTSRTGRWTLRIPVTAYEAFLADVRGLGDLMNLTTTSEEVTAEYYDVEARIRNKRKEEERLLAHLESSTGKLEDILAVERELTRVREELERLEGRMRVLKDLTSLTTITLVVNEIRDYVPPESPTFTTRITRRFAESTTGLVEFGQYLVLGFVALIPWLPVIAVGLGALWFVRSRIRRRTT